MFPREVGRERADDVRGAFLLADHGVEVALDDHELLVPALGLARVVEAEEEPLLLEESGDLGRVEKLGLVLVAELAAAERERPARLVADREEQPLVEEVARAALPIVEQPQVAQEPDARGRLLRHGLEELAAGRSDPDAPGADRLFLHAAWLEHRARGLRDGVGLLLEEIAVIEVDRALHGLEEVGLALRARAVLGRLLGDRDAEALRDEPTWET